MTSPNSFDRIALNDGLRLSHIDLVDKSFLGIFKLCPFLLREVFTLKEHRDNVQNLHCNFRRHEGAVACSDGRNRVLSKENVEISSDV